MIFTIRSCLIALVLISPAASPFGGSSPVPAASSLSSETVATKAPPTANGFKANKPTQSSAPPSVSSVAAPSSSTPKPSPKPSSTVRPSSSSSKPKPSSSSPSSTVRPKPIPSSSTTKIPTSTPVRSSSRPAPTSTSKPKPAPPKPTSSSPPKSSPQPSPKPQPTSSKPPQQPSPSPKPTPTPTPPPPPPSNGGNSTSGGATPAADIAAYLKGHNDERAKHGAAPLTFSEALAAKAKQWANNCQFKHSGGSLGPFGENLAAGTGGFSIQSGIQAWNDESKDYNPSSPQASHWTQVVWKASTEVGCAVTTCTGIFDGAFANTPTQFYVCEYSPQGNFIGRFPENVQK